MIEFTCSCGQRHRVKDESAGKKGRCKSCGTSIQIPVLEETKEELSASLQVVQDNAKNIQEKGEEKDIAGIHADMNSGASGASFSAPTYDRAVVAAITGGTIGSDDTKNTRGHSEARNEARIQRDRQTRRKTALIPAAVGIGVILMIILFKAYHDGPLHPSRRAIERMLDAAIMGHHTASYWENPDYATRLFNVKSYKHLSGTISDSKYNTSRADHYYRIQSTNKGGQPIEVIWWIWAREGPDGWKIYMLREAN